MDKTGHLSPLRVEREGKPGRYCDGGGLYLEVKPSGTKNWLFRYQHNGKPKKLGLGPFSGTNSLATARKKAAALRGLLENKIDPQADRAKEQERQRIEAARAITFQKCAETYISTHEGTWKNDKHRQQWINTLATYVHPIIGGLPVGAIDTPLILRVMHQTVPPLLKADGTVAKVGGLLWNARPDTARRVRGRIEMVLDWAKAHEYRNGENPARWRGNLSHALPKRGKRAVQHHPALPFELMPAFMAKLRAQEGTSALALAYLIYNAPRTMEALGAKWSEIDDAKALWTIPEERMKAGLEHRIPLSEQALAVLDRAKKLKRPGDYVFPGRKSERPLSISALLELIKPMGFTDKKGRRITVHGFRSTFRDWVAERTSFPSEVADMALAHVIGDDVEAAYRRGELLEKRRALMVAWANYCCGTPSDNVIRLDGRAA